VRRSRPGSFGVPPCRSERCSAFSAARRAGALGLLPASALNFMPQPRVQAYGAASGLTSCATLMRSRCRARAFPLLIIQRQLGHADLAITSVYLRGIDNTEIVHTVHERPAPMVPVHSGLPTDP
jgi:integrase